MSDTGDEDSPYVCHRCGAALRAGEASLYVVRIEAFADPSPPSETGLHLSAEALEAEIDELLRQAGNFSERELMDQVCRRLTLTLCVPCYRHWIENPTG